MIALALAVVLAAAEATPTPTPLPSPAPLDPRLSDGTEASAPPSGPLLDVPIPPAKPDEQPIRLLPVIAGPSVLLLSGVGTWAGLAGHTGDGTTPALELLGGVGGGISGTTLIMCGWILANPEIAETSRKPRPGEALMMLGVVMPMTVGLGTWAAAEDLEGRSQNEWETLAASLGGAFLGQVFTMLVLVPSRTTLGPQSVLLTFVPAAAGATLAYRAARGEFGRDEPLSRAPVRLTVIF